MEWSLVHRALAWWQASLHKHSRHSYFAVPRRKVPHAALPVYSRAFGGHLRATPADIQGCNTIRLHPCKKVAHDFYALHIEDVIKIVVWDVLWGWSRFGLSMVRGDSQGFTQGSLVSPGVCVMTLCFVEYENKHLFDFNAVKWTRCVALQWIDDLYLVLSVFGLAGVFDGARAQTGYEGGVCRNFRRPCRGAL